MSERPANLRPGGLPDIQAGDRWLVKLRGAPHAVACMVERKRPRGYWRVVIEPSLQRVEVKAHAFLALLPPKVSEHSPGALTVELRRGHAELRRLADEVARLREERDPG